MVNTIKFSQMPSGGNLNNNDLIPGLLGGNNVLFGLNGNTSTWTPVFTFDTPGDLSVVYTVQDGNYTRIGSLLFYQCTVSCIPTFTTSSGDLTITGLPIAAGLAINDAFQGAASITGQASFPSGTTSIASNIGYGATYVRILCSGSAGAFANMSSSNFTTGLPVTILATGFYFV